MTVEGAEWGFNENLIQFVFEGELKAIALFNLNIALRKKRASVSEARR
ncbi:MAG: hypothetical protein KME25_17750 [Symplocastrum torsivum CPER-KK1]|uniref:Uncharacterized protein n=1 Tax=Symplocastrum torsivum CPER-KK1 TaxID=450513 RepID=A0A951UAV1_9CYAN|nr:hypothetical protein [Symplocastrum torsivum CPER-KK1]